MKRLICLFMKHRCFIEDLNRVSTGDVTCICNRCGKALKAYCGLALNCEFQWIPKEKLKQLKEDEVF